MTDFMAGAGIFALGCFMGAWIMHRKNEMRGPAPSLTEMFSVRGNNQEETEEQEVFNRQLKEY